MSPRRIVSLLPSATEIVCALGAADRLVGISHECDYPEDVAGLPVLTAPRIDPGRPSDALHRDHAVEPDLLGLVDLPDPALAQRPHDAVAPRHGASAQ